ncbi:MAG: hypothetical protein JWR37_5369 [Mycobacterium sp.]|jgi:hypothetical protein|nr:hypothetical protein [Mycobacterium sp.]
MDLSERTPAQTIDEAHEDLNNATTAPDEHRRQQYARSAQDAFCEVSLDARSTREQKAAARENLVTAMSMTGELSALARNIRAKAARREQSGGIELD